MKNGFRSTLDKILIKYGMKNVDTTGYVIGSTKVVAILRDLGYNIGEKIYPPVHGFIYLSEKSSTLDNLIKYLTKLDNGCIIICRIGDDLQLHHISMYFLTQLKIFEFAPYKYLGVIVKGI